MRVGVPVAHWETYVTVRKYSESWVLEEHTTTYSSPIRSAQ